MYVKRIESIDSIIAGIANRGWGGGYYPPTPPRDGPKNQLTFLFKAFFSFFSLIISYML